MTDSDNTIDYSGKPKDGVGDDVAAGDAAGQQAKQVDDAAKQSADASGPDLSFLSDELRSRLVRAPDGSFHLPVDGDSTEQLRKGYLREDHYTRARQKDAGAATAAQELAAQYQEKAKKWEDLESDSDLKRDVLDFYARGEKPATAAPTPAVPDNLFELSPQEFAAAIFAAMPQQASPQKPVDVEAIKAEIRAENDAPIAHLNTLAHAADEWNATQGLDKQVVVDAATLMSKDHGGSDNLNPDLVTMLMPRYTEIVKAQAAAKSNESTQQLAQDARAASPRGGIGTQSPSVQTAQEEYDALAEKLGRAPDEGTSMKMFYRQMMESRAASEGKPVSELEKEYEDNWQ